MKSPWLTVCVVAAVAFLRITQANPDEPAKAPLPATDPMRSKEAGDVRDDNGLKMKLVWCPPGFFTMEQAPVPQNDESETDFANESIEATAGTAKEVNRARKTEVKVGLTHGYWLAKYELTQAEWKQVMKTEPWKGQEFAIEGDEVPATYVNWNDATEFCRRLTEEERKVGRLTGDWEYRLPTEAQWDRACRARTATDFNFGDDASQLGDYAWWGGFDDGNARTEQYAHQVGLKKANPWGLHDMHGNVWEWCRDSYSDKLPGGRNPEVLEGGPSRVLRSGGWNDPPRICRSASRLRYDPSSRRKNVGLRVALSAVQQAKPVNPEREGRITIDK